MAFNYVFVGLGDKTINVPSVKDITLDDLKHKIEQRGVETSGYSFYHNGCPVTSESESLTVSETEETSGLVMIRAYPRVLGGKGGFGALIRSMGSQMNKNRSRDACRDLSGRRMRDVNAEKKMSEWMKKEPERKRKKAEERKRKRNRLLEEPRHFFNDPQYMQKLEESEEVMGESLKKGLQATAGAGSSSGKKRAIKEEPAGPSKKSKLWLGLDEYDELDSGGEDEGASSSTGSSDSHHGATQESSPGGEASSSETDKQAGSSPDHETTPTEQQCSNESTTGDENVSHEVTTEDIPAVETTTGATPECTENPTPEPIKLDEYDSVEELETAGGDRLKVTLQSMGLKCGGTVRERAERLLSVKGKQPDEIKPSLFARPSKGKGKGKAKSQTSY